MAVCTKQTPQKQGQGIHTGISNCKTKTAGLQHQTLSSSAGFGDILCLTWSSSGKPHFWVCWYCWQPIIPFHCQHLGWFALKTKQTRAVSSSKLKIKSSATLSFGFVSSLKLVVTETNSNYNNNTTLFYFLMLPVVFFLSIPHFSQNLSFLSCLHHYDKANGERKKLKSRKLLCIQK